MDWQRGRDSDDEHCLQVRSDAVRNGPSCTVERWKAMQVSTRWSRAGRAICFTIFHHYLFCLSNSFTTCSVTSNPGW